MGGDANGTTMDAEKWMEVLQSDAYGQKHLIEGNPNAAAVAQQLAELDKVMPGGVKGYIDRAGELLQGAKEGLNPLEGYKAELATGVDLSGPKGPGSLEFEKYEQLGMTKLSKLGFVLVAGGLGERLGYPGIKVELPADMSTGMCFLELYCKYVKAISEFAGEKLPFFIMTSGDTDARTRKLLEENNSFGLAPDQIVIQQQDKVPAFGTDVAFQLEGDGSSIETKPHGHGDVHILMYTSGEAKAWAQRGLEYVLFFQDTNPLAFRAVPAMLGVAAEKNLAMNSLAVPRKAKEAAGAIVKLVKPDDVKTVNVEYCHLGALLADKGGDIPINDQNDSAYPGNCNVLLFHLPTYVKTLEKSKGVIKEFVNPKFQDDAKTKFKPTRLECLMQDFPWLLEEGEVAGFTTFDRWLCFTCVKNNLEDAAKKAAANQPADCCLSAECDMYACAYRWLKLAFQAPQETAPDLTAEVDGKSEPSTYLGVSKAVPPKVVLLPSAALSLSQLRSRCKGGNLLVDGKNSMAILEGPVGFEGDFTLTGAVDMSGNTKAVSFSAGAKVENTGATVVAEENPQTILEKIRGYKVQKDQVFTAEDVLSQGLCQ